MTIADFQKQMADLYLEHDTRRGLGGTFMWFMEEVGELSTALRSGTREEIENEFADAFAWLTTLANLAGIDADAAVTRKYGGGCPCCNTSPCSCVQKP
ncbi:MAG TPA: MazG nucleotide pyrophosphohydrolase domain-containing protein [Planctomycetota bacterium]|nr:MazG nucleotide pyrophosphohydrolase domain-containing protein [Planctomycetota bacterium]